MILLTRLQFSISCIATQGHKVKKSNKSSYLLVYYMQMEFQGHINDTQVINTWVVNAERVLDVNSHTHIHDQWIRRGGSASRFLGANFGSCEIYASVIIFLQRLTPEMRRHEKWDGQSSKTDLCASMYMYMSSEFSNRDTTRVRPVLADLWKSIWCYSICGPMPSSHFSAATDASMP